MNYFFLFPFLFFFSSSSCLCLLDFLLLPLLLFYLCSSSTSSSLFSFSHFISGFCAVFSYLNIKKRNLFLFFFLFFLNGVSLFNSSHCHRSSSEDQIGIFFNCYENIFKYCLINGIRFFNWQRNQEKSRNPGKLVVKT